MQPILRGKMLADLLHPAKRLGVLAALGVTCGCSLNPQPLPPGESSDAATGQSADATNSANDSGGSFGGGDASLKLDGTADAAPGVPPEGGDAASDAAVDGPLDAVADGPQDAPSDGGNEDGE